MNRGIEWSKMNCKISKNYWFAQWEITIVISQHLLYGASYEMLITHFKLPTFIKNYLKFAMGEKIMTDQELQNIVEKISLESFNAPFLHKAYFNKRLRTTGGRYLLHSHNIEFNPKSYEKFGIDELRGIILHELCHYHLHIRGKGYKHRDADFRALLKQVGAPRFCSTIEENKKSTNKTLHIYQCEDCKFEYSRKRRVDTQKYRCGKCHGKLVKLKEIKR